MTVSDSSQQTQGVPLLSTLMKIQMIAFLIYGVTFFFIPAWTLQAIFAFDQLPPLTWPRAIGGMFLAIAFAEYLCDRRLSERLDLAWFFATIPGFLLVAFIWDRVAGTYGGSELFYWVTIAVTAFFFIAVGGSRLRVKTT
jgi:hypothetical protein